MGLEWAGTRVINAVIVASCVILTLRLTTILYTHQREKNRRCAARYSTTSLRSVEYEYGPSGGRLEYVEYVFTM